LVLAHWSAELFPYPRPEDRIIVRELANAELDFFVGHHPHVVSGMEVIDACPVFYCIGNFFFFQLFKLPWR
jgi:gamma-polyglutamate biosynthesis protein CapA